MEVVFGCSGIRSQPQNDRLDAMRSNLASAQSSLFFSDLDLKNPGADGAAMSRDLVFLRIPGRSSSLEDVVGGWYGQRERKTCAYSPTAV